MKRSKWFVVEVFVDNAAVDTDGKGFDDVLAIWLLHCRASAATDPYPVALRT